MILINKMTLKACCAAAVFADAHYTSAVATRGIATFQQGHVKNVRENGMALCLIKCNSIHSHWQIP